MSGATFRHGRFVNNLAAILRSQLGSHCDYRTTDQKVHVPSTGLYTYPDVVVICGKVEFLDQREDVVLNPVFIAEVLSPSTASYDRSMKFAHYRTIPAFHHYMTVTQDRVNVEHYAKQPDGAWLLREYSALSDIIRVDSIQTDFRLSEIYA